MISPLKSSAWVYSSLDRSNYIINSDKPSVWKGSWDDILKNSSSYSEFKVYNHFSPLEQINEDDWEPLVDIGKDIMEEVACLYNNREPVPCSPPKSVDTVKKDKLSVDIEIRNSIDNMDYPLALRPIAAGYSDTLRQAHILSSLRICGSAVDIDGFKMGISLIACF